MNGLEQTFYIMAIVYMGVMFVAILVGLLAVLAIKRKLTELQDRIEDKLSPVFTAVHIGAKVVQVAKTLMGRR